MFTPYTHTPKRILKSGQISIASFIGDETNADRKTIASFGEEWKAFHQFSEDDLKQAGNEYFDIVTDEMLNQNTTVLDVGCGSGRWSYFIADKVKNIEAIDPSDAVYSAAQLLASKRNVRVTHASTDTIPFDNNSFDFVLCLGVLHHIPDTQKALSDAVSKLKTGGYALLYFYYNLENRSALYRALFAVVDLNRRVISRMPNALKRFCCDAIALVVYMPLVAIARCMKSIAPKSNEWQKIPLSYYCNKSFHIMRNDALDRFGTPLEKRFSRQQIEAMMKEAGLDEIVFSDMQPYWHCAGRKST
ncbi:MAG: class I SAM-dependent methyltransferase [Flavobacteriales bacterium]